MLTTLAVHTVSPTALPVGEDRPDDAGQIAATIPGRATDVALVVGEVMAAKKANRQLRRGDTARRWPGAGPVGVYFLQARDESGNVSEGVKIVRLR